VGAGAVRTFAPYGAFSMNLKELKGSLEEGFMRTDLEHRYVGWINRAIHEIQDENDWPGMKDSAEISISSGLTSAPLPVNMKALTTEQYPVHVRTLSDTGWLPCPIQSEEHVLRYRATSFFPPTFISQFAARSGVTVFVRDDVNGKSLNLPAPASQTLVFRVSFTGFTPPLVEDTDENFLTRDYPELVEPKVLAVAFRAINDSEAQAVHEDAYEKALRRKVASASKNKHQGRPLRMGG
jgi:hypothetical protein